MYLVHAQKAACINDNFRNVLLTTSTMQVVLMNLEPNETIDKEKHDVATQLIRVEYGSCVVTLCNKHGKTKRVVALKQHDVVVIAPNQFHIVTAGLEGVKILTIYSPPQHEPNLIQHDK